MRVGKRTGTGSERVLRRGPPARPQSPGDLQPGPGGQGAGVRASEADPGTGGGHVEEAGECQAGGGHVRQPRGRGEARWALLAGSPRRFPPSAGGDPETPLGGGCGRTPGLFSRDGSEGSPRPAFSAWARGGPSGEPPPAPAPDYVGEEKSLRRFKWKPDESGQKGRATREDLGSQAGAGEASGGRTDPIKRGSGMRLTSSFLSQVFFFLPGLSETVSASLLPSETGRKMERPRERNTEVGTGRGAGGREAERRQAGKGQISPTGSSGEQRSRCRTGRGCHQVRSGRGRRGRELHKRGGQPLPCGGKRAWKSGEPRGL